MRRKFPNILDWRFDRHEVLLHCWGQQKHLVRPPLRRSSGGHPLIRHEACGLLDGWGEGASSCSWFVGFSSQLMQQGGGPGPYPLWKNVKYELDICLNNILVHHNSSMKLELFKGLLKETKCKWVVDGNPSIVSLHKLPCLSIVSYICILEFTIDT